ncbi:MAG: type III pantothenate kinase [Saezia sp.]
MKLLAIDIGNTRLKWALYSSTSLGQAPLLQGTVFLEHLEHLSEQQWANLPEPTHIIGSCVAAPSAQAIVDEQLAEQWEHLSPLWIKVKQRQCGVTNGYDHPARLGVDRWVALIGARKRLLQKQQNFPAIVVMIGTAVTVDAMDCNGDFLGGLIMPGHGMMLNALQKGTAGLHVPTGEVVPFPTNTSDALSTGGTYAIVGAIERMTVNLEKHTRQEPKIFLTGGAAWKVANCMTKPSELIESLIFDGILSVADYLLKKK